MVEIWYDEGTTCTFYTVKYISTESESPPETDKFFDKYAVDGHPQKDEALQLFRLITESIGNRYGATDDFFDRHENTAQALPPKPKDRIEEIKGLGINFPLRLYCYRVTKQIVVLFNGGIKSARTVQESGDLRTRYYEAQRFARKIQLALQDEMICISACGRQLESFDGQDELIL